jgi:hypothetical protein
MNPGVGLTTNEQMIYLRGWWYAEGIATVPAERSGAIELVPDSDASIARCQGFFHTFEGRSKSAVFVLNTRLIFQLEQRRWDWVDDNVRIVHRRRGWGLSLTDSVSVYGAGVRHFKSSYTPPFLELIRLGDMTVDCIDDETSNWWLWLARIVMDGRDRDKLLALWGAGI